MGTRLPKQGNTKFGQRGSGHLAVSSSVWVAGLIKPAQRSGWPGDEAWGKPGMEGAYTNQRFNLTVPGKAHGRKPRFQTGPDMWPPEICGGQRVTSIGINGAVVPDAT